MVTSKYHILDIMPVFNVISQCLMCRKPNDHLSIGFCTNGHKAHEDCFWKRLAIQHPDDRTLIKCVCGSSCQRNQKVPTRQDKKQLSSLCDTIYRRATVGLLDTEKADLKKYDHSRKTLKLLVIEHFKWHYIHNPISVQELGKVTIDWSKFGSLYKNLYKSKANMYSRLARVYGPYIGPLTEIKGYLQERNIEPVDELYFPQVETEGSSEATPTQNNNLEDSQIHILDNGIRKRVTGYRSKGMGYQILLEYLGQNNKYILELVAASKLGGKDYIKHLQSTVAHITMSSEETLLSRGLTKVICDGVAPTRRFGSIPYVTTPQTIIRIDLGGNKYFYTRTTLVKILGKKELENMIDEYCASAGQAKPSASPRSLIPCSESLGSITSPQPKTARQPTSSITNSEGLREESEVQALRKQVQDLGKLLKQVMQGLPAT